MPKTRLSLVTRYSSLFIFSSIFVPGGNMKIVYTARQLKDVIGTVKKAKGEVGFVPTMGALHQGHLSLVRMCKIQNELTVVSIFVNPSQFNDKNDLKNYPRTPEKDIAMLKEADCDVVFIPDEKEIYPEPDTRIFDFGGLDSVMEGKHRPGHFNGVAQVVTRLFQLVEPQRAYFGLKDFQQLAILRKVVKDYDLHVELVACPIIRETDGLAMSSRNMLLTPEQRSHVPLISKTLFLAKEMTSSQTPDKTRQFVADRINQDPLLHTEYFEIVNDTTLKPVKAWSEAGVKIGCVAVKVGSVRLIDNIIFSS
jgi:pantoate--beta-alanine ligase